MGGGIAADVSMGAATGQNRTGSAAIAAAAAGSGTHATGSTGRARSGRQRGDGSTFPSARLPAGARNESGREGCCRWMREARLAPPPQSAASLPGIIAPVLGRPDMPASCISTRGGCRPPPPPPTPLPPLPRLPSLRLPPTSPSFLLPFPLPFLLPNRQPRYTRLPPNHTFPPHKLQSPQRHRAIAAALGPQGHRGSGAVVLLAAAHFSDTTAAAIAARKCGPVAGAIRTPAAPATGQYGPSGRREHSRAAAGRGAPQSRGRRNDIHRRNAGRRHLRQCALRLGLRRALQRGSPHRNTKIQRFKTLLFAKISEKLAKN